MSDNQLKFLSAFLLMLVWGGLVLWKGASMEAYIDAIKMLLAGLGVYHIKEVK